MCVGAGGGGHLFLLHGDTTRIACSARLVPCDDTLTLAPHPEQWRVSANSIPRFWRAKAPLTSTADAKRSKGVRAFECKGYDASGSSLSAAGGRVCCMPSNDSAAANAAPAPAPASASAPTPAPLPKLAECVPYAVNLMPVPTGDPQFAVRTADWFIATAVQMVETVRAQLSAECDDAIRRAVLFLFYVFLSFLCVSHSLLLIATLIGRSSSKR